MRILHVNAFAGASGGAEVYCHQLMEAQRKDGHRVGFFAGHPEREERSAELCIVRRPEFRSTHLIHDRELETAFERFAAEFRPDLVHLHNTHHLSVGLYPKVAATGAAVVQTAHDFGYLCPNSWCTWADGTVCAGGPGKKCFEHGCEANYPFDGRIVLTWKLRYEVMRRCVQHFPCPSQFLADKLTAHGFPNAVGLPLWTEGSEHTPSSTDQLPPAAPNRVLYLGRLVREKGVEYLLRAWPSVQSRFPDAVLEIVGGGPEEGPLRALAAELGLDPARIFVGKVPHGEVETYLRRATLQVLPSIWCENSPVTTYESYAVGLPMVASDIAGLPAMVRPGETGLLARPRDAGDLAEQIGKILADPGLRRRLSQGCLDAARRYPRSRHLEGLERIYSAALAAPRPPADVDADMLGAAQATLERFGEVETWANNMHKHIQWLESQRS